MNSAAIEDPPWIDQYDVLTRRWGLVDLGARAQIEVGGTDRAAFLHNLCTNEVRKLAPGAGCEAFLTSVQGKTLAHVLIFVGPESIVISTAPDQAERIIAHLDHYLVSEQVTLTDRSTQWSELFLGGPEIDDLASSVADTMPPRQRLAHTPATLAGRQVWLRRADLAGPDGLLLSMRCDDLDAVRTTLISAGAASCSPAAFEAARIEWGFPLFGTDISDSNLPQEVGRDAQAISFTKGCYLGQETVARIDALGHVNKTLVGLRFSGTPCVSAGHVLVAEGRPQAEVTSVTYSPRLKAMLALAYARRGYNTPGARLGSNGVTAVVTALPVT